VDDDVLEEHTAHIFRVEVCRVKNWLGYVDRLQGICSKPVGSLNPVQADRNMKQAKSPFQGHNIVFHDRREMFTHPIDLDQTHSLFALPWL
jgi:hypothetical protein